MIKFLLGKKKKNHEHVERKIDSRNISVYQVPILPAALRTAFTRSEV